MYLTSLYGQSWIHGRRKGFLPNMWHDADRTIPQGTASPRLQCTAYFTACRTHAIGTLCTTCMYVRICSLTFGLHDRRRLLQLNLYSSTLVYDVRRSRSQTGRRQWEFHCKFNAVGIFHLQVPINLFLVYYQRLGSRAIWMVKAHDTQLWSAALNDWHLEMQDPGYR